MNSALIGSTGFVGSHLRSQKSFSTNYNSKNILSAYGEEFDLIVCAAAPGSMFEANKYPDRDAEHVRNLIDSLSRIKTERFILISSIAVLDAFDSGSDETTSHFQTELAYGRNRRLLEEYCNERFENCLIVRLPALFGSGLKKNFVFDILNPMPSMLPQARFDLMKQELSADLSLPLSDIYKYDDALGMMFIDRTALEKTGLRHRFDEEIEKAGLSAVQFTNRDTTFQYYDMTRLWHDIELAMKAAISVIHLAPEPLFARTVYQELTGKEMPVTQARLHHEDMRTSHANLWGKQGSYMMEAHEVLNRIKLFFASESRTA